MGLRRLRVCRDWSILTLLLPAMSPARLKVKPNTGVSLPSLVDQGSLDNQRSKKSTECLLRCANAVKVVAVASGRTHREARDYFAGEALPEVLQRATDGVSELSQHLEGLRPPFRGEEFREARIAIAAAANRHRQELIKILGEDGSVVTGRGLHSDADGRPISRDLDAEGRQES